MTKEEVKKTICFDDNTDYFYSDFIDNLFVLVERIEDLGYDVEVTADEDATVGISVCGESLVIDYIEEAIAYLDSAVDGMEFMHLLVRKHGLFDKNKETA